MQIGSAFSLSDGDVRCSHCDGTICETEATLKEHLPVREGPVTNAGPTFVDESRFVNEEMVFREFFCPDCGSLLFTETAREGDPVMEEFQIRT